LNIRFPSSNFSCQIFYKMFDNDLGRGAMRYDYSKGWTKLTYELK